MKFNELYGKLFNEASDNLGKGEIKHLEHIEDLLLIKGTNGIDLYVDTINKLLESNLVKDGDVTVSIKIDGSPALIYGFDSFDNKFFVSTKSLYAKIPKMGKSIEQIHEYWGDIPDLETKMKTGFMLLSQLKLQKGFVWQGDVLFTQSNKKEEIIEGKDYITFTANTITYAIPQSDSELYNKILNSDFGIVLHTQYVQAPRNLETDPFVLTQTKLDKTITDQKVDKLYITNPIIDIKNSGVTFENKEKIKELLQKLENEKQSIEEIMEKYNSVNSLGDRMRVFLNKNLDEKEYGIFGIVQNKKDPEVIVKDFIENFKKYIIMFWDKEKEKVATEGSKMKKEETKQTWLKFIDDNYEGLKHLFKTYILMIEIKYMILESIEKLKFALSNCFVKNSDGTYQRINGEGFVISNSDTTIKFVDRISFSALNRLLSANRKK